MSEPVYVRRPLNLNQRLDRDTNRIGIAVALGSGVVMGAGMALFAGFGAPIWMFVMGIGAGVMLAAVAVGWDRVRHLVALHRGYIPADPLSVSLGGRTIYKDPA